MKAKVVSKREGSQFAVVAIEEQNGPFINEVSGLVKLSDPESVEVGTEWEVTSYEQYQSRTKEGTTLDKLRLMM